MPVAPTFSTPPPHCSFQQCCVLHDSATHWRLPEEPHMDLNEKHSRLFVPACYSYVHTERCADLSLTEIIITFLLINGAKSFILIVITYVLRYLAAADMVACSSGGGGVGVRGLKDSLWVDAAVCVCCVHFYLLFFSNYELFLDPVEAKNIWDATIQRDTHKYQKWCQSDV